MKQYLDGSVSAYVCNIINVMFEIEQQCYVITLQITICIISIEDKVVPFHAYMYIIVCSHIGFAVHTIGRINVS